MQRCNDAVKFVYVITETTNITKSKMLKTDIFKLTAEVDANATISGDQVSSGSESKTT